jgi:hypothetical protein
MEDLAAREPYTEWSAEDGMIKREESFQLSERDSGLYVFLQRSIISSFADRPP